MQHPRGIAVILGVVIALGIIAAVVTGVFLVQRTSPTPKTTDTNTALNLACTADADCTSYCGADPCYQPICGVTAIGAAGSCTCRSICGPIATTNSNGNTNTTVNTNSSANTNASVSTAGWKTYTDPQGVFSFKYPTGWTISADVNPAIFMDVNATGLARPSIQVAVNPQEFKLIYTDLQYTATKGAKGFSVNQELVATGSEDQDANLYEISFIEPNVTPGDNYTIVFRQDTAKKDGFDVLVKKILSTFTFTTTISKWKTYTSTSLAYSFRYPEFYIATAASDGTVVVKNPAGRIVVDTRYRIDAVDGLLSYWFDTTPVGDAKLGNRAGKKFIYKYCDGPSCGEDTVAFVVQHQGKLLGLEFVGDKEMSSTEQIILSTFTFTK